MMLPWSFQQQVHMESVAVFRYSGTEGHPLINGVYHCSTTGDSLLLDPWLMYHEIP